MMITKLQDSVGSSVMDKSKQVI